VARSLGLHHLTLFDPATENQTVAFNIQARVNFKSRRRARMSIWQAMEMLDTLVDESDPDVSFSYQSSTSSNTATDAVQTNLSQIEHLLQTAEAIRRDGKPEWMQVTGLVHDLGKLLFLFDSEGQWDVVGVRKYLSLPISDSELGILILGYSLLTIQDTFVVGCRFSDKIIYPETFAANPDSHDQIYSTEYGIYQPHCGLDNVMLSWGHDEVGSYH
jgi:inositol oxygenase